MNDETKRLLELAAKAAGVKLEWHQAPKIFGMRLMDEFFPFDSNTGGPWRPHVHDGDALRLAVKLGLLVDVDCHASTVTAVVPGRAEIVGSMVHVESLLDADYGMTATRMAIVRAAADIGEAMP